MVKELFSALLGAEAPPVAPADLTDDPHPTDRGRARVLGWLAVAALGVIILGSLIAILTDLF
jgi:hypothetical protein